MELTAALISQFNGIEVTSCSIYMLCTYLYKKTAAT